MAKYILLVVVLMFIASFSRVDSHNCEGATALRSVSITGGWILTDIAGKTLCGFLDGASAARACWDLGLNEGTTETTRTCRCSQFLDGSAGGVPNLVSTGNYGHVTVGMTGFTCSPNGDPDCLFSCATNTNVASYTDTDDCDGALDVLALKCEDIDECVDGALVDCTGPFEFDCVKTYPCGPHATCTNTPSSYTCECVDESAYDGAGSDPYNLQVGCLDTNECDTDTTCFISTNTDFAKHTHCVNTIGSFTCWCDAGFEYVDSQGCQPKTCATAPPTIANAAGWTLGSTYDATISTTCSTNYEASVSDSSRSITTECRLDGNWCQCNFVSCQPKKCGVLPFDGNAETDRLDGVAGQSVTFTCLPGFETSGDPLSGEDDESQYTLACTDGGAGPAVWEKAGDARCEDNNECDEDSPCPEHSDCYNTLGSYHCICHLGYEGPTCEEKVSCGKIPDVANSFREDPIGTVMSEYKMSVTYECEDGFRASSTHDPRDIEDKFTIKCKLDKCWSPDPIPECVPITCGDPGIVEHASRYGHSFFFKQKVAYTCYDGFKPSSYAVLDSASYKTFYITCEKDGWSSKSHCVDVNECEELQYPCGTSAEDHICINLNGTYTCSCSYGFQLDTNGQECKKLPEPEERPEVNPCAVFNVFGFCNGGTCFLEAGKEPHCRCPGGLHGPFCDQADEPDISIPFVLSAVGTTVAVFSLLVCMVLACYVCARHCGCKDVDYRHGHTDVHADIHADVHHDVHVSRPVFKKPLAPFPTRYQAFSM